MAFVQGGDKPRTCRGHGEVTCWHCDERGHVRLDCPHLAEGGGNVAEEGVDNINSEDCIEEHKLVACEGAGVDTLQGRGGV